MEVASKLSFSAIQLAHGLHTAKGVRQKEKGRSPQSQTYRCKKQLDWEVVEK